MSDGILISGATGFLGTNIIEELLLNTDSNIYALVRAESMEHAIHRLKGLWYGSKDLYNEIGKRIVPILMDLQNPGELNLEVKEKIQTVIHAAALIQFQKSRDELFSANVKGTENMVKLAKGLPNLKSFVHVSTAYVSGTNTGLIKEEPQHAASFSGFYEESKAKAEELVSASGLPYIIVRPGMIIGDSKTGKVKNFNTIYYALKLLLTNKLPIIPTDPHTRLNLVPVDYVAHSIVRLMDNSDALNTIFHLTCPESYMPEVKQLADYVVEWAKENLNVKIVNPKFVSSKKVAQMGLKYGASDKEKKKNYWNNLLALAPYFINDKVFSRINTDALLGPYHLTWKDYMDPILEYAVKKNFMNQNGNTVFEQARIRNKSTRYPINYYNVEKDRVVKVGGKEVNERIEKIVDALYAVGLRKGDKVALTGINSIEYMCIDQALGLSGIVSVPLYYTAPIDEVELLMAKSQCEWLFVGDRRIMTHIEKLPKNIHVVAFSDGLEVHKPNVMHFEQFLYQADQKAPVQYPNPEDLATIRYTSGTTGEPKGVMFNYAQLAWMGEVLTNLLSWKDRNQPMRYLSFLPLSHVVEGILASYAPYYLLTNKGFYFLNDFGSLTDALPKVRPTVFFSVPRFYEKVWAQLTENSMGQRYLNMKDSAAKKALGALLKTVILRKAGLDACDQLIVGSAPIGEGLLRNFRELGIEIYNAYGQAEAPLITINRIHDNVIPTIGTPLPETRVTVAEDGELIVEGPQVTLGYYGLETDTISNGVLKTGDLGFESEDGHFTLIGRKKEMIITAYGKNISIPKIEERLKNINGISEAVLIGEKRPYCTALLWVDYEIEDLDKQIEQMNADLSHPEQIRKYTIIKEHLSIAKGELTPNLKVKRRNVEAHFETEIEAMYQ